MANADTEAPVNAYYKVTTRQAGTPEQVQYLDKLSRPVRTVMDGFSDTDRVATDIQYNARGLKTFESVPYHLDAESYGTYYDDYDPIGRLKEKRKQQADGTLTTEYTYSGFTTTIEAGDLPVMTRTYNSRKQLVSTTDSMGGTTRYAYDNMGNPIIIRDASGNDIKADYNGFGHKLEVDDPNMGNTVFITNGFGDVEHERDANQDTVDLTYDLLGSGGPVVRQIIQTRLYRILLLRLAGTSMATEQNVKLVCCAWSRKMEWKGSMSTTLPCV